MHKTTRDRLRAGAARGLLSVRADAGAPSIAEINAMIVEVNKTFAAVKETYDRQFAELRKGQADVVTSDKMARIDAALAEQQKSLDDANRRLAAVQIGGAGQPGETPEARQHAETFRGFMRGRIEARTTTYTDPDGGFLAPPSLDMMVTRIQSQTLAMRRIAQVQPITSSGYVKFKSIGGAGSGWVGESESNNTARAETTTASLARMEFAPGEVYAEPNATQQALDDMAIDVEGWLAGEVSITFNEQEGGAFITGNGVKKPRGILAYDTVANASYTWGKVGFIVTGAAATFATSNPADAFIDTIHALKAGYRQNATWLMNDLVAARVRKFKDGQGNYLWQPTTVAGMPSQLLGYNVETDDNMPDVAANVFPVAFGDFRQAYLVVDRTGVRVLRNPFKVNGLVAFYTTKRVGGGIQNFEAIKLLKCST